MDETPKLEVIPRSGEIQKLNSTNVSLDSKNDSEWRGRKEQFKYIIYYVL